MPPLTKIIFNPLLSTKHACVSTDAEKRQKESKPSPCSLSVHWELEDSHSLFLFLSSSLYLDLGSACQAQRTGLGQYE